MSLKNNIPLILFTLILLSYSSIHSQASVDYCTLLQDEVQRNKKIQKTNLFKIIEFFPLPNTPSDQYIIPNISIGITKIEKSTFLNMKIVFQKNNIKNYAGYLQKKEQLILHFINGGNVILLNLNETVGKRNKDGLIIYNADFFIPRENISHMKESDLDYISLNWTNGATTYETYQVDVLRKLLNCIQ